MAKELIRSRNKYYIARRQVGRTVDEVAEATGYDRSTIYKVERGEITPSAEFITALSDFLNIALIAESDDDTYPESVVRIIQAGARAPMPKRKPKLPPPRTPKGLEDLTNTTELHNGILQLISNELDEHQRKKDGEICMLWTGKKYDEFNDFYENLYEDFIPFLVQAGLKVRHFWPEGETPALKLDILASVISKTLKVQNRSLFRIEIVRQMNTQAFVNDLYHSKYRGNIMTLTNSSLWEPSMGIYGDRKTELFDRYIPFLETQAEERVLFFSEEHRKDFFSRYRSTQTRTGDWFMLQKTPANATRPLVDFTLSSRWGRRTAEIERQRRGPGLDEMIFLSRTGAQLFRDRLTSGRFRQIMSREAVENWIKTGSNPALAPTISLDAGLIDNADDIKARLKNIITLMDDTNGNFQIALANESSFRKLGWAEDASKNLAWVVQGAEATVFEGHRKDNKSDYMEEYHIIAKEPALNDAFAEAFEQAWRSLDRNSTDQRTVREFLLNHLRQLG